MKKLLIALLCIANACFAQNTISDYLSVPFPTELKSSDDGNTIAWVFDNKGSRNIFIAQAPSFAARQITSFTGDDGMAISDLTFTPDGTTILFVRGNDANEKGEAANPAQLQTSTEKNIWRIRIDGTHLQPIGKGSSPSVSPDGKQVAYLSGGQIWMASLTEAPNPQKLFQSRGRQIQIRWSPDGSMLAFVSDRNDHGFIGIYSFSSVFQLPPLRGGLGRGISFPDPTIDKAMYPVWSPDGQSLAYINVPNILNRLPHSPLRASNPWSIRIWHAASGKAKEVWKADTGRGSALFTSLPVATNLLWWGINNQLIFPYEKNGWQHLYALDTEKGTKRLLTPGEGEIENAVLSKDGQSMYYTTNINDIDRRHIWRVNINDGSRQQLTKGTGIEWSPVVTATGLAFLRSSATRPAWPAIYQDGVVKDIAADLFPSSFPGTLVQPQAVSFKAKDGMRIPAQLFLPSDYKAGKKYPAIVYLHGGSRRQMLLGFHYSRYYSDAYAINQYFANRGYIVLSVNFRSGIGYGLEFREALNYGTSGASEVNDVIGAGLYLRSRNDVVSQKIALWGGSYGGYLTAHGLAQASDLFACGVDIHGVHNWKDHLSTVSPWYDWSKFPDRATKALQSSPVHYIKGWRSPVLLIHGDDDRNVPFSESVNLAEKLRQQGVHVEQLVFPDEVHDFLLHRNWVKVYETAFNFIERQMQIKK